MKHDLRAPLALLFLAAAIGCTACSSTDIGNPDNPQSIARTHVRFVADDDTPPGALTLDQGIHLDEAWIAIERLEFYRGAACNAAEGSGFAPVRIAELISASQHPGPADHQTEPQRVCRVDVVLGTASAASLPLGAPADLIGNAIVLSGRRSRDNAAFTLRDDATPRLAFDILDPQGLELFEGDNAFLVAFEVRTWLDLPLLGGLLDDLVGGLLGPILGREDLLVIDLLNNLALLDAFRKSFVESATLYRDRDRDGILDPDERANPIATSRAASASANDPAAP